MAKVCMQARVTGRVQGVFFRASTQQQGIKLGVTGYAKNLIDGSVEVMACGEEEQVEALMLWLETGSVQSQVEAVEKHPCGWQVHHGFEVL